MRYFFVSYGITDPNSSNGGFANSFCTCEKAPCVKTLQTDMEKKSNFKFTVLNIQELTEQDYNDFILESQQEGSEGK